MASADVFASPLGLLALASVVPLLLLYLLKPEPDRLEIPTVRFLAGRQAEDSRRVGLRRLQRALLLLVQLAVLVLVATALAAPHLPVPGVAGGEAVVVIDASASMATQTDGGTRFDRALEAARAVATDSTTVIVSEGSPRLVAEDAPAAEAGAALDSLAVVDVRTDLGDAIVRASALAGAADRLLVLSDFSNAGDWRTAVRVARGEGIPVRLEQFDGGGADNVGIVAADFDGESVTVTVANAGSRPAERTLRLGGKATRLSLQPGDVVEHTFGLTAGPGRVELTPRDSFPTDDVVPVVVPAGTDLDVLVVTNDENRYLTTALSLVPGVNLRRAEPPTTITRRFDVIVFSNVDPDRLLRGTVEAARETVTDGGSVVIQAQPDLRRLGYGDLLAVEPSGLGNTTAVRTAPDPLTADITFPPPRRYVRAELRSGRALVCAADGSPLIATADLGGGESLYYGYIEAESSFKYNYLYPVFWKRAVFSLAERPTLDELNRATGDRLVFEAETAVAGPGGGYRATTVPLERVGVYEAGRERYGAALLDAGESNVTGASITAISDGGAGGPGAGATGRIDLSPAIALAALGVALGELAFLRSRGDL